LQQNPLKLETRGGEGDQVKFNGSKFNGVVVCHRADRMGRWGEKKVRGKSSEQSSEKKNTNELKSKKGEALNVNPRSQRGEKEKSGSAGGGRLGVEPQANEKEKPDRRK